MNESSPVDPAAAACSQCGGPLTMMGERQICPACTAKQAGDAAQDVTLALPSAAANNATEILPGSNLAARYQQLELLGRGGMGEVYRARQTDIDRVVALKLVLVERASDPMFVARFRREAMAMGRLSHPHIVSIYDFGIWDGRPYLTMEFVAGTSLRSHLRPGPLAIEQAFEWGSQLCDAMGYAHEQGIVHRDLKPENVLVTSQRHLKVADFGLAKLADFVEQVELTGEGAVLGTLRYMAPEQLAGSRDVDERADVYSLGVMLYEMFTGTLPMGRFALPSRLVPVDRSVDAVLLKALDADPRVRFANARELARALAAVRSGDPLSLALPADDEQERPILGNLPRWATPLVGREDERQWLRARLMTQRLVTLTGPGGTGKTRMALQIGLDNGHLFSDGVWFVSLAEWTDPQRVISAIAAALRIHEESRDMLDVLCDSLAKRELLLILDNFEQVVTAAPIIVRLLAAAPRIRIVVTSRMALRVSGENEFPIGPLKMPRANMSTVTPGVAEAAPAVALFVSRARAARPDFQLTTQNLPAVLEICRRLDGLPLAIELAAARVRLLPPESLAPRLSQSLKLLTGGARDLPFRQQTMRAAIAWSYQMLSPPQRTLLAWLSLVRGCFSFESVERLARHFAQQDDAAIPTDGERLDEFELIDAFTVLVDHHLLRQVASEPVPRFSMYETIREFGEEQLQTAGDPSVLRHAHATWCLETVTRNEPSLVGSSPQQVLVQYDEEMPDYCEALAWWRGAGDRPEDALRLIGELWYYWVLRGTVNEGIDQVQASIERSGTAGESPVFSRALHALGTLCYLRDRMPEARAALEHALEIRRRSESEDKVNATLANLASVKRATGDLEGAVRDFQETLAYRRRQGDKRLIAVSLSNLSLCCQLLGRLAQALETVREALTLYTELRDKRGQSRQFLNLGRLHHVQGRYDEAIEAFGSAERLSEVIEDPNGVTNAKIAIANALTSLGRYDEAQKLFDESEARFTPDDPPSRLSSFHIARGYLHWRRGDAVAALADYRASLRLRLAHSDSVGLGEVLVQIAEVYVQQQRPTDAARIFAAEAQLREQVGYDLSEETLADIECSRRTILDALGAEACRQAEEQGRLMSLEDLARQTLEGT